MYLSELFDHALIFRLHFSPSAHAIFSIIFSYGAHIAMVADAGYVLTSESHLANKRTLVNLWVAYLWRIETSLPTVFSR
jgi:hypothetical protein